MSHFNNFDLNFLYNEKNTNFETFVINDCNNFNVHNNDLTVFSLNIRSIRKHFNELLVVLSSANIKFDIIMLSETWLDNNIGNFDIKGYNCYNHYSSLNISDGISVYIRDSIIVNDVITGGVNHCSSLDFSISYNNILIK